MSLLKRTPKTVTETHQNVPAASQQVWHPFARLRDEIDQMFAEPFGAGSPLMHRFAPATDPAVEMRESDDAYDLVAEVPGMKAEDIDIKLSDGVLRLSGEKSENREGQNENYVFSERSYGRFERAIKLPNGIEQDDIAAQAQDGLLTIHMPKSAEAKQSEKVIPVNAS